MEGLFPARAGVIPMPRALWPFPGPVPRTRGGDPLPPRHGKSYTLLFPARAGVIPYLVQSDGYYKAVPRTRGGDPDRVLDEQWSWYCSPHARG